VPTLLSVLALAAPRLAAQPGSHPNLFRIEVIDAETGRGVPLVELATVNNLRFLSDSAGNIAIAEPDLLNEEVWFTVAAMATSSLPMGLASVASGSKSPLAGRPRSGSPGSTSPAGCIGSPGVACMPTACDWASPSPSPSLYETRG
jgi:hypothetical protein